MTRHPLALCSAALLMCFAAAGAEGRDAEKTAFDFDFQSIEGPPMALGDHRGKVLLVVNTASFCGFTHQYQGLQKLWETYRERGLVVVGVPSNDFGEQEPKAEGEIKDFCQGAFGVTFPLTSKNKVSGSAAHPFYQWAAAKLPESAPRWNFHKILVGRDGRPASAYRSNVEPLSSTMTEAIERELAK
jgi:glutathione peroxidase